MFSGSTPSDRGDHRPAHGLRLGGGAARQRRLQRRHHHHIGDRVGGRHVGAMADETAQRIDAVHARVPAHALVVARLAAVLAGEHEGDVAVAAADSSRAASIMLICPFHGAMRPGTSTTRMCGSIPQARRSAAMRSALTAAGLKLAVSTARGITVMRSGAIAVALDHRA